MLVRGKEFWINEWQLTVDGSQFHKLYPDEKLIWDVSARKYDLGMGKGKERVEKVLNILDKMGFWNDGVKRILDIGSGTGSFAIPLAVHGALVDALDNSEEMNNILREKCAAKKISNINILPVDFCEYSPPDGTYDLVLGSMNPCLYEPDNFLKMISLSHGMVIFIGITGENKQKKDKSLAELLTGLEPGHNGSNHIIYPFNLLLSMGLEPIVDYVFCEWEYMEEPEQAKESYKQQFEHLKNNVCDMERIISGYVDRHIENGMFIQRSSCAMGIVACRVAAPGAAGCANAAGCVDE